MRQHKYLFGDDFVISFAPKNFNSLQKLHDDLGIFIYKSSIAFLRLLQIKIATRIDIDMFGIGAGDVRVFVTAALHRLKEEISAKEVQVVLAHPLDVHLSDDDVLQEKLSWTPGRLSNLTNRNERWLLRINE